MDNQQTAPQTEEQKKAEELKAAQEKEAQEKEAAEKAASQKKKPLTLDQELEIMKKDQERNLKAHAEALKKKEQPKIPAKPIELESEKFKK